MTDNRTTELKCCIKCIDDMTDDLLEIADVLEEHQINVKLDNERYLNPVSAIRSKVDVIWEETLSMAAMLGSGTCVNDGSEKDFACSSCGASLYIENNDGYTMVLADYKTIVTMPNFCPNCGRKVVNEC